MAYVYKKLTDVPLVESAIEPNVIIEDSGDIKKFPHLILLLNKLELTGKKLIQIALHLF